MDRVEGQRPKLKRERLGTQVQTDEMGFGECLQEEQVCELKKMSPDCSHLEKES